MRKFVGVAVLAAMFVGSFAAHAAEPRTVTQSYIAAGGDLTAACFNDDEVGVSVALGGQCFDVDSATDATVSFTIADDHNAIVGAFYSWQDADGKSVGEADFTCNEATDLAVPAGATVLFVEVEQALSSLGAGIGCGVPSAGTTGTITATFTPVAV